MDRFLLIETSLWQVFGALVVGLVLFLIYRWVRAQSRPLAALLVIGVVSRAALGVALFWISFLNLPVLRGLQLGDGFWQLAPDARHYYRAATFVYLNGWSAIPDGTPSATFVKTLAGWMRLVGLSPASALYLNVTLYVLLFALVVRICRPSHAWRAALPCIVCLTPVSVMPVLLAHASQPLKDEISCFFVVILCLAVFAVLRAPSAARSLLAELPLLVVAWGALALAIYGMLGIRSYSADIATVCLMLATPLSVLHARKAHLSRALVIGAISVFVAMWAGSASFDGPAQSIGRAMAAAGLTLGQTRSTGPSERVQSSVPSISEPEESPIADSRLGRLVGRIRSARKGFASSGGATNMVPPSRVNNEGLVRIVLDGLGATFVPISIAKALGWVDFAGGRGLLFVTDIDTLLLDFSILAAVALLIVRRRSIGPNAPYVFYTFALALLMTLLLAVVVTNYGTLFRLRLLMAVPFWMLPLAVARPSAMFDVGKTSADSQMQQSPTVHNGRQPAPSLGIVASLHSTSIG